MNDTPAGTGDVTARMENLERQNRRLHIGLVALGLVAVAALFFDARPAITQPASATFGTLKAHAFLLTDRNGKTRAALFFQPDGQPKFVLFDAAGKQRVGMALGHNGRPGLGLLDAAGKPRMGMVFGPQGRPALDFWDAAGKARVKLFLGPHGQPRFLLLDAAGKVRGGFLLVRDGRPRLALGDANSKPRLVLGSETIINLTQGGSERTPVSSITAFDNNDHPIARWPSPHHR